MAPANSGGLGPRVVPSTSKSARGSPSRGNTRYQYIRRGVRVELLILWITGFASPPNLDAQRRPSRDPLQKPGPYQLTGAKFLSVAPASPQRPCSRETSEPRASAMPTRLPPASPPARRHAPRSALRDPDLSGPSALFFACLTSAPDPTRAAGTLPLQNTTLPFYAHLG